MSVRVLSGPGAGECGGVAQQAGVGVTDGG